MAAILQLTSSAAGVIFPASSTNYFAVGDAYLSLNSLETTAFTTIRAAGTYSNLYVRVIANAASGAGSCSFRKNILGGNQTVSITASTTGEFKDVTHTDAVVATDVVDYVFVGGTGGSITVTLVSTIFTATSNTVARLTCSGATSYSASTTQYSPLVGETNSLGSESIIQFKMRMTGTFQNLQAVISVNTRADSTTFNFRKNTANGNQTISIATLLTGTFEDLSNTDGVVTNDLVDYRIVTGAGLGALTFVIMSVELSSTANLTQAIGGKAAGVTYTHATTVYTPVQGNIANSATESDTEALANVAYTASKMSVHLNSNGVTAASTMNFRKNAGSGSQTLSITSGTTGVFVDSTNTDSLVATDEINYQFVMGATGTTATMNTMGHLATLPTVAASAQQLPMMGVGS